MQIPVCSVQMICRLHSQSKFHMLALFSGRHIGAPQSAPTWRWALKIQTSKHFDKYLKFGESGEVSSLSIFYDITIS